MNLEPMWTKLEEYQQYAEGHGFGEVWKRMTTERTVEAANAVGDAAWGTGWKVFDAREAAREAASALGKADPLGKADMAISFITLAIERENKP